MTGKTQTIAVIVPSFERPDRLRSCLAALAVQVGGPWRTYVVDDGSRDPLAPVCAGHDWVTCIRQQNAGPATARNSGAAAACEAGATFLCFTDDDCRPRPDWATSLAAAHGGEARRLVGGRVENALPDNVYATASQSLSDYLYEYFGAADGTMPFFTSNNIGCAAASYREIGGFDQTFPLAAAEDRDFGLRWQARIGPLVYARGAVVDHAHPLTLRRYWRQHMNYGRGARHLGRTMDARGDDGPRRQAAGFYAGLVLHPLRARHRRALSQSALMVVSQIATFAGYAAEKRSER